MEGEPKGEQSEYEDQLAQEIEFSEEEDMEEEGGITIKNAAQYLAYKPAQKKGRYNNKVDESKYFEAIAVHAKPNLEKGRHLRGKKGNLIHEFGKNWKENRNAFTTDF
mmetsp:Transcript_40441/g.61688  ORF Transcript_40441/g.61688 Transcript_40441/m.61688 type:complete len:108 (+) Transcript_40441:2921-3244(+)